MLFKRFLLLKASNYLYIYLLYGYKTIWKCKLDIIDTELKKRVSSITDSKESCRGIRKLPESINQPMSAKHYLLTIS